MFTSNTRAGVIRRPWIGVRAPARVLLAVVCVGAALTGAAGATAASRPVDRPAHISAGRQLAVLDYEHRAYASPRTTSQLKASVPAHRPITYEPTTLPVLGQATDRDGQRWLRVMLPGRPNGSTGWIRRAGTRQRLTGWYIHVSTAARRLWIYDWGRLVRSFSAVVGKASTPTPTGRFFVEETVVMPASEPGGPYALALSGRSDVLRRFDGGPGQIAIHGRDGLGGTPGQAQSHGCMRLTTSNIDWLAARIVPGTPVTITAGRSQTEDRRRLDPGGESVSPVH